VRELPVELSHIWDKLLLMTLATGSQSEAKMSINSMFDFGCIIVI